jgi:hypothetical protein
VHPEHLTVRRLRKNVERAAIVLKPIHGRVEGMSRQTHSPHGLTMTIAMSTSFDSCIPSDIVLLLRADAEQRWLNREVLPVLRQLESLESLVGEQVGAALAYLEASWSEAMLRARATDAAHTHLPIEDGCREPAGVGDELVAGQAARYHTAVRALRAIVAERVAPYVDPSSVLEERSRHEEALRVSDTRDGATSGCAPRAA